MSRNYDDNLPLPNASRHEVARDTLVFQAKLFTDGLKDILLSPLALFAGLIGIVLGRNNPGVPLYELLRFGRRVESWIDLFAAAYREPNQESSEQKDATPAKATQKNEQLQDFDALIETLQSSLFDPETRSRLSDRSKSQLDAITKKLKGE